MTVSRSPVHPAQQAIYERLSTDATLVGLGVDVFDYVPEDRPVHYIVIGDHLSIPDNAHGEFGRQITTTIHVWTRTRGNVTGQAIANRVAELVDHQPLTVDGHQVVSVRLEFDQALKDPDPEIRHHIQRYRIITAQEG